MSKIIITGNSTGNGEKMHRTSVNKNFISAFFTILSTLGNKNKELEALRVLLVAILKKSSPRDRSKYLEEFIDKAYKGLNIKKTAVLHKGVPGSDNSYIIRFAKTLYRLVQGGDEILDQLAREAEKMSRTEGGLFLQDVLTRIREVCDREPQNLIDESKQRVELIDIINSVLPNSQMPSTLRAFKKDERPRSDDYRELRVLIANKINPDKGGCNE